MEALRPATRFPGGVRLAGHKDVSTGEPIGLCPRPRRLILPLQQHAGTIAEALVAPGDEVARGQPLARSGDYVSAPLHAPASGTVKAIEPRPVPHPSGLDGPCIVLDLAAEDRDWEGLEPAADWTVLEPGALRERIRDAGIVGLGGAAFPTHVKLTPGPETPIHTLILNGAECEPYISCDQALMRERAGRIIDGARIMLHAIQAERCLVALEEDKQDAAEAMTAAIGQSGEQRLQLVLVPVVYPQGGERQLIRTLTGSDVPPDDLPLDVGVVCQNVGTAEAVARAIIDGEPLTSRIVTVTGGAVVSPRNLEVLLGTPMADVIAACGGYQGEVARLIMGGPMMGFALATDEAPVVKGTNCILAAARGEVLEAKDPQPCIRCGECAEVCPAYLFPQQLHWYIRARDFDAVGDYNLFDCIECGCCDYVCPSHIPLVDYFRYAKAEIWRRETEHRKAELARARYDARQLRLEQEQRDRGERLRRKQATGKAEIEAAIARAKAKRKPGDGEG